MGVLEIVDFARDFAVMVRVQGPDPKGLKMREQAFHHYNSGKTTLSASGMLLPRSFSDSLLKKFHGDKASPESMLAVTVASVIEPFLSLHHRKNFSQANPELIPGVQIDIMIEGKKRANAKGSGDEVSQWLQSQLLALTFLYLLVLFNQLLELLLARWNMAGQLVGP